MNDDQLDLARRLAAHPRFQWQERMYARDSNGFGYGTVTYVGPNYLVVDNKHETGLSGVVPDLTDAATGGVLLDMLGPMHVVENIGVEFGVPAWRVRGLYFDDGPFYVGNALAESCARALLAGWEATPATPETT